MSSQSILRKHRKAVVDALFRYTTEVEGNPWDLSDVGSYRILACLKSMTVRIVPTHGLLGVPYYRHFQAALDRAGLRYRYDLDTPNAEGRFVSSPVVSVIWIPVNQQDGPWGYCD